MAGGDANWLASADIVTRTLSCWFPCASGLSNVCAQCCVVGDWMPTICPAFTAIKLVWFSRRFWPPATVPCNWFDDCRLIFLVVWPPCGAFGRSDAVCCSAPSIDWLLFGWTERVIGELDGVLFMLFTTVELVIAAGALFNKLIIAALLFDLIGCTLPVAGRIDENKNQLRFGKFKRKLWHWPVCCCCNWLAEWIILVINAFISGFIVACLLISCCCCCGLTCSWACCLFIQKKKKKTNRNQRTIWFQFTVEITHQ